jgi:hypothetical protein
MAWRIELSPAAQKGLRGLDPSILVVRIGNRREVYR